MLRHTPLVLVLIACALPGQAPRVAATRSPAAIDPPRLFAALDGHDRDALAGQDVDHLYRLMTAGRPHAKPTFRGAAVLPFSDGFGRETRVYLRVPEKPRALLVLLHGLGGNERQLARAVSEEVLEREGLILLAPCAQSLPPGESNSDIGIVGKLQPHWWSYDERGIVMSAILSLARLYDFDRDRVYLCGHSMGGFGAWNLGLRFADRFAAAAPLSGGLSRREYLGSRPHRRYHLLLDNAVHLPFFFAHGDDDALVPVEFERRLHEELEERGIAHVYEELEGQGHMIDLGRIMPRLSAFILSARRDPHPRRVVHRVIEQRPSRSFWVRIDETWAGTARIEAEVRAGNEIVVTSSGVESFTIFLDEALVDLARSLRVVANGKVLHEGLVKPDLQSLLASWYEREDPALVHRAALQLRAP